MAPEAHRAEQDIGDTGPDRMQRNTVRIAASAGRCRDG